MDILHSKLLILLTIILHSCLAEWWYLGVVGPYTGTKEGVVLKPKDARSKRAQPCENMQFLELRQRELCNQGEFIIDVISEGAAMAITECLIQFKDRRWNCSTFDSEDVFGRILDMNSREKSFVYSITSAGVMHTITTACARGEIGNCGCDKSVYNRETKDQFQWGGCSHNPSFGDKFAMEFVDKNEQQSDEAEYKMNLWNNEAGRRTVKSSMKTKCKCHGVSASCAVKICWRSLAPFSEVGDALKRSYDGAVKMRYNEKRDRLKPIRLGDYMKKPKRNDLVFLRDSPNFCDENSEVGSMGTIGRPCNSTSPGLDGCEIMCCGRGYYTEIREVEEDCNCQFVWCCKVECQKCRSKKEFNYCK